MSSCVINSARLTNSFAGIARLNICLILIARTDNGDQMLAAASAFRNVWEQLSAPHAPIVRLFKRKSGLKPAEYRRLFGRRRFERYKSVHGNAD